jgi:hypothetical protein
MIKFLEDEYVVGENGKQQSGVIRAKMLKVFRDPRKSLTAGQIRGKISRMTKEKKGIGTNALEMKKNGNKNTSNDETNDN